MGSILIGTSDGLYRLGDRASRLRGREVRALAPAPAGGLWALLDGTDVVHAADGGEPETVARLQGLEGHCLLADGSDVLVGASDAHLLTVRDGRAEPIASFDDAPGRREWYTPWGGPPDTRSLAVTTDGAWLANVHVGGILRSADRGATWTATLDIDDDVHQVVAAPQPGLVIAAAAVGLLVSADGGQNWERRADGLHATYARAAAVCGDTVLVSASTGPHGGQAAVYRGPLDGSAPLERCDLGAEWFDGNIDTGWIAATTDLVVVATPDGGLHLSADEGRSWERVAGGLPPTRWVTVAA